MKSVRSGNKATGSVLVLVLGVAPDTVSIRGCTWHSECKGLHLTQNSEGLKWAVSSPQVVMRLRIVLLVVSLLERGRAMINGGNGLGGVEWWEWTFFAQNKSKLKFHLVIPTVICSSVPPCAGSQPPRTPGTRTAAARSPTTTSGPLWWAALSGGQDSLLVV